MFEIYIPVKPHVKSFLMRRYGEDYVVNKKNFLGILLLELLNTDISKLDLDCKPSECYKLQIPELYFNTKGFNIDKNKLKFLGRCLERLFFDDFYNFVDSELERGGLSAYKSVHLYLQLHKISENELKLESMYRNYQRHSRENIKSKKTL